MGGGGSKKAKDKGKKDDGKTPAKPVTEAADHILKLLLIGDASVGTISNTQNIHSKIYYLTILKIAKTDPPKPFYSSKPNRIFIQ